MKKLFIISAFLLSAIGFSQNTVTTMTGSGDTITNTGTDYVQYQPTYNYENISFEAVVTKISGTVSGTGLLQGSIDGTNFKDISTDTMALTDQTTNKKIWVLTYSPYKYYRVTYLGVGTMSAKIYGYMFTNGQGGKGQNGTLLSVYSNAIDTVTNTGTKTLTLRVNSWYRTVVIQPVLTKISGTVGGTVTLQGSNDGTNYVTVSSSYSDAQTLSASNVATQTKLFKITGSPYAYYRLSYTGTGTMSCKIRGYVWLQK